MLLVHASPTTLAAYEHPNLGVLCSPRRVYGAELEGWRWAADNDAYSDWNTGRYRLMLDKIAGVPGCVFVTLPDVVGDSRRTLTLFHWWRAEVKARCGQPLALVAQDGLTAEQVPWSRIDALFVGGSTEWKLGESARQLVTEAKQRGLWVHMGRVNSQRRLMYAKAIGCDSIDGTSISWFRDHLLPGFLAHAAQPPQMVLA